MSSIGARVGLIHFCDIMVNHGGTNSWGDADASWEVDASYVPCRAWTGSENLIGEDDKILTLATRYVILPLGTTIDETYRIGNVYLRDRSVLWDDAHSIDEVVTWPDRLEVSMRKAV